MCFGPQRRNFWFPFRPDGSAPAALASLLFDPPEPLKIGSAQFLRLFCLFARALWSSFLLFFHCSHHCCCICPCVGKFDFLTSFEHSCWLRSLRHSCVHFLVGSHQMASAPRPSGTAKHLKNTMFHDFFFAFLRTYIIYIIYIYIYICSFFLLSPSSASP